MANALRQQVLEEPFLHPPGLLDGRLGRPDGLVHGREDCGDLLLLRERGDLEAATQHYHKALRITPEDVEILNDLAGALTLQGDVEGAIGCYRVALHLEPDMAELHVNLGQAVEQQGNTDAAVACYEKAVELDPRHVRANQCLVDLVSSLNR